MYSLVKDEDFDKTELNTSLKNTLQKERKFILYIVVIFLICFEKIMSISTNFASILFVRRQIMEAQKGDCYWGEFEGDYECCQR